MSSSHLLLRSLLPFSLLLLASAAIIHQSDCDGEDDRLSIGETCVPRPDDIFPFSVVSTAEEAAAVAPSSCADELPCDDVRDENNTKTGEFRCRAMPKVGEQSIGREGHLYLRRGCPEGAVPIIYGWCAKIPEIGERCLKERGPPGSGRCGPGGTCVLQNGDGICQKET